MTINECIKQVIIRLQPVYGNGEATTMAGMIIESVILENKNQRVLSRNAVVEISQQKKIDEVVGRLLRYEPLQYILNEAWFNGSKFYVDANVLIPRPETEELVSLVPTVFKNPRIIDVGTGSGCIGISLKKKIPGAEIWALDISGDALTVAKKNAEQLQSAICFVEMDFLNQYKWHELPSFDIIISNPPYVTVSEKPTMEMNVLQHEPSTALFVPDNDPLVFYRAIAEFGKTHLQKQGNIYCEINAQLGSQTKKVFEDAGYSASILKDMQGKNRFVAARFDVTQRAQQL